MKHFFPVKKRTVRREVNRAKDEALSPT